MIALLAMLLLGQIQTGPGTATSGSNTGDVTLGSFGSSPNANAASLSGQVLTLQPANGTQPGGVSTAAQTLGAGDKTFLGAVIVDGGLTVNGVGAFNGSANIAGQVDAGHLITTGLVVDGGSTFLGSSAFSAGFSVAGGITASGSSAIDFSGSSGAFKTSTGANAFGGNSNDFTNRINAHADIITSSGSGIEGQITGNNNNVLLQAISTGGLELRGNVASAGGTSKPATITSSAIALNASDVINAAQNPSGTDKARIYGDGSLQFVGIATGSLISCAGGTAGAMQYDTTKNQIAYCNGSAWQYVTSSADWALSVATNQTTGTGLIQQITTTNAGTYRSANFATDVTGIGGGNFVVKICSDGSTCAGGNTFATCTVSCIAAANTITSCTAGSKTTYTAGTTISISISTACATTNQIGTLLADLTTP